MDFSLCIFVCGLFFVRGWNWWKTARLARKEIKKGEIVFRLQLEQGLKGIGPGLVQGGPGPRVRYIQS